MGKFRNMLELHRSSAVSAEEEPTCNNGNSSPNIANNSKEKHYEIRIKANDELTTVLDRCLKLILFIFNFVGLTTMSLLPKLHRNWKKPIIVYCFILLLFHAVTIASETYVIFLYINKSANSTSSIGRSIMTRANYIQKSILHILLFIFFERSFINLNTLLKEWKLMEADHNCRYGRDVTWRRRLIKTTLIIVVLRLIAWPLAHIFHNIYGRGISFDYYLVRYITKARKGLYEIFGSSKVASGFALIMANLSTLNWEAMTLYFLVVFQNVRERWKLMHDSLLNKVKTGSSEIDWEVTRRDYVQLVKCTDQIDKTFSPFMFVYIITGVYWLLYRLHLGITGQAYRTIYRTFYFCHTAGFLIVVILSAASIIDRVEDISNIMDDFQGQTFGEKAERFEERCRQPIRGITGCRFFFLNRSLVNMIIGILFTYEVVLLEVA